MNRGPWELCLALQELGDPLEAKIDHFAWNLHLLKQKRGNTCNIG